MTNKIEISRSLAERLTRPYPAEITDQETMQAIRIEALAALDELRALLAAPAVERQDAIGTLRRVGQNIIFDAIGDPYIKDGMEVYTSPPAPVAVVLPEPIYQVEYRGDGGGGWVDVDKESYDMKTPHPKHWRTRIVYAEQPAPVAVVHTMKSVMSAICAIIGFPMLTSNQCHALAQSLNAIACLDKVKEMNE